MAQQAWSFKAINPEKLRYWGNDGYHDNSSEFYRYNSFVANHKNVKEGDIVIITNREQVLGVSVIKLITKKEISKEFNKCINPDCDSNKITYRKVKKPQWRCSNGHEFDSPRVIFKPAVEFISNYGEQFKKLTNITMDKLKNETQRYNDQGSIQEINLEWAVELLDKKPDMAINLEPQEADSDMPSLIDEDQRNIIERQIKQRRGQKKFRDELLKLNPICAITGCELIDILEAAHIDAYRNDSHNHISNGLLLRSDIHTLFDLNLCAIDPENHTISFSAEALKCGYQTFDGVKLIIKHNISISAISKRWWIFKK